MGAPKKLVYVTMALEEHQHESLKFIAYKKRVSMSELIREALERFIPEESTQKKKKKRK